jgi:uncharacterized protein YcbK (DUF882 family)
MYRLPLSETNQLKGNKMLVTDWDKYAPFFYKDEFDCKHTGQNKMTVEFMDRLLGLRKELGIPFIITSGFRHPTHPSEAHKSAPGTHTEGIACDIQATTGTTAGAIIEAALRHGFKGIGVAQDSQRRRSARFVHLDLRKSVTPVFWSY